MVKSERFIAINEYFTMASSAIFLLYGTKWYKINHDHKNWSSIFS